MLVSFISMFSSLSLSFSLSHVFFSSYYWKITYVDFIAQPWSMDACKRGKIAPKDCWVDPTSYSLMLKLAKLRFLVFYLREISYAYFRSMPMQSLYRVYGDRFWKQIKLLDTCMQLEFNWRVIIKDYNSKRQLQDSQDPSPK